MNPVRDHSLIEKQAIQALQGAIDKNYRRLLKAAKTQWERTFAGKDPSDACVRVRVAALPSKSTPAKLPAALILGQSQSL